MFRISFVNSLTYFDVIDSHFSQDSVGVGIREVERHVQIVRVQEILAHYEELVINVEHPWFSSDEKSNLGDASRVLLLGDEHVPDEIWIFCDSSEPSHQVAISNPALAWFPPVGKAGFGVEVLGLGVGATPALPVDQVLGEIVFIHSDCG